MKIYQLVTTLGYGDAVGNHIIALKSAIEEIGYPTEIYTENIDKRLIAIGEILPADFLPDSSDIIIYHLATATDLNYKLRKFQCRKILIYHNITPPDFFSPYNKQAEKNCADGLRQAKFLADCVNYCMPVSGFNAQDLRDMGYSCPCDIVPILIKFEDYLQNPDAQIIRQYSNQEVNIVFCGRIAPNKKQEDVILAFYYYKKYYNPDARLFLVGSYSGMEIYQRRLEAFCRKLRLSDVIFTGHISFDKLLAYYRIADIFLCMSEHEGFCVPLVEAMYFGIPIIAYDSSAIAETLGGSGLLVQEKNPLMIAGIMNRLVNDVIFRAAIVSDEKERLKYFEPSEIKKSFTKYLKKFINSTC